ncbi:MAG: methyltransferase [Proteobacteria bacterium]|nr:methyltransferase [Pseudomonadota bacterium]
MTAGSRHPAAPEATSEEPEATGEEAEAAPHDAVSEDRLLGGRVRLSQPVEGYRAAIDPVFLAAAVPARAGESVLDLVRGAGAAALCLLARVPGTRVTGLELQADLVRLAGENARANGAADRFFAIAGDVARPPPRLAPGAFHHVLCNPPQLMAEGSRPSPNPARDAANREGEARLADWVTAALAMVRPKGSLGFVHRADRLDALLAALVGRAGEIVVFPLWPRRGQAAKRILLRARKGVATPLRLSPGLVLHEADGRFTPAANAVLREGKGLEL